MEDGYHIRKKKVFFEETHIPEADASSMKVLSSSYMRDAGQVFCEESLIDDADPESFEIICDTYTLARDAKHVYSACWRVKGADPESLRNLDGDYFADKKAFYHGISKVRCDFESFETIGRSFARDRNHCFWSGARIKDADLETFRLLDVVNDGNPEDLNNEWASDKHAIYNANGRTRLKTDGASFQLLNRRFAKDKERVFCFDGVLSGRQHILRGADPVTFEVVDDDIASDVKAWYLKGERFSRKQLKTEGFSDDKAIQKYILGLR